MIRILRSFRRQFNRYLRDTQNIVWVFFTFGACNAQMQQFMISSGMERKDLLSANVKIFKVQGEALDQFAKKDVKVLVVGNPANTNALICSKYAPTIPKENFTAMTRLDQNRAQAQIAAKVGVSVGNVS